MSVSEQRTITGAPLGTIVRISGDVASMMLRPKSAVPAFEVEITDETGALTLVWLGRHSILGISPGRRLTVEGRVVRNGDLRLMYNPRYELHPRGTDER